MSRVEITLPAQFAFETTLAVYIGHINRGNHLANEALLSLLNEARVRYLETRKQAHPGLAAVNWINADLAVIYKSEVHHGEQLRIEIAATGFHRRGCDFIYRVSAGDGRLVAIAKTAMLVYDYEHKRLAEAPSGLANWLG